MAVVSAVEIPRERSQSGKFRDTYRYTRGWMVRVDDPGTPLPDITDAVGVQYLDPHPDDALCLAQEFTTKPESNSLLHYTVAITYFATPTAAPSGDDAQTPPQFLPGIPTVWTATSSVGSGPVRADVDGKVIANSSGTPFPKLEADRACFKLSLKRPWPDWSWQALAVQYTNAVNSDTWMGCPPRSWKCQGVAATPESQNESGVSRDYWMVEVQFEYRAPEKDADGVLNAGWDLCVLDQGYRALVDSKGIPCDLLSAPPGSSIGTIRDTSGQPIKEPVGLRGGWAVKPPNNPDTLVFQVYRALPFTRAFGV